MWKIYGVDSPNVTDITNPKIINVGLFKESSKISINDFNNVSNEILYINGLTLSGAPNWEQHGQSLSAYTQETGTNLLAYNRFNILHRTDHQVPGTHIIEPPTYEYDGCAYTWIYETAGTNIYYLNFFEHGTQMYHETPKVLDPDIYASGFPKSMVMSCRLVATETDNGGVGVCRPLWEIDFTSIPGFSNMEKQYFLGKALPTSTIKSIIYKPDKQEDDDSPDMPVLKPENADQHAAVTPGHTWQNEFKVMNWTGPWPNKYLIDFKFFTDGVPFEQYLAFNALNDPEHKYHTDSGIGSIDPILAIQTRISNDVAEWGSDVALYAIPLGTNDAYFSSHNQYIDSFGAANYQDMSQSWQIKVGELTIDYTHQSSPSGSNNITNIRFYTHGKYFSLNQNYGQTFFRDSIDLSNPSGFGHGICIVRYSGEYYLGGMYRFGSYAGFGVICRISNLTKMSNFDRGQPGDPRTPTDPNADPDGVDPKDLDNAFGDGTGTEPNPTTYKLTNEVIGDAPSNTPDDRSNDDGSAYTPDGVPKNPAAYDTPGTGEKNTNPVDTSIIPNAHDGSLGNGTGNPHQDDAKITDPGDNLPPTLTSPGTVTGSGVLSVFTPSQAQLNAFTAELLSTSVLDSIKNYFTTNPMDGIFGLHILPYSGFSDTAATAYPRIGTHTFTSSLTLAEKEFLNVDYGTVYVPFVYDGYENYAPNSDVKLFLPFLGTKEIDINIIQGCNCTLKYNISLVTGDIYAYLYCTWAAKWGDADNDRGIDHLVYSWQGNCAATVPLSHLDSTNYISGAMQAAGGIVSLGAGAVAGNPTAIVGGATSTINGLSQIGRTSIITSGNISGMAAFMGSREPYFIFSRPIIAFNSAYNHYIGLRSNAIETIGNLRDNTYTVMRNVDLKGINATADELSELESILKGGFYI